MSTLAICISTMLGCLVGSFVPLVNTELVVAGAAAAAPRTLLLPLVLIASTTQMAAKAVLYLAGGGLVRLPRRRWNARVQDALEKSRGMHTAGSTFLFASALTGIPPFYVTSVACGAMRLPFARFMAIGLVGRTLRFTVVVLIPFAAKVAL